MRRGLSFCLMLVLVLTMAWVPVIAEEAVAKIEIRTPEVLPKAGEEFEVVAYISNNPGFCAIQFALFAENKTIECKDIELGEVLEGTTSVKNPTASKGAVIGAITLNSVKKDGIVATYSFTAKEDVENLEFMVGDIKITNYERQNLPYLLVGATEVIAESPSKKEEVPVEPPVEEHLFADTAGHWAERYINTATEEGFFKGDELGCFNPDENVTRAQFVTVLWRMAGSPVVDKEVPFEDIDNQIDEFKSAIAWGYSEGFINGNSETTFEPEGSLTREAAMKILHFYSGGESGNEVIFTQIYDGLLEDSGMISGWAKPSVYWGIYHKLISGTTKTTISPQDTATRAQLAKILVNFQKFNTR
ncbi:MAG: S-layer homology domain-containing protein [Clostridia bacterium]|nr:S-layer homology domain-containing protein [Clostridia bacterium]